MWAHQHPWQCLLTRQRTLTTYQTLVVNLEQVELCLLGWPVPLAGEPVAWRPGNTCPVVLGPLNWVRACRWPHTRAHTHTQPSAAFWVPKKELLFL